MHNVLYTKKALDYAAKFKGHQIPPGKLHDICPDCGKWRAPGHECKPRGRRITLEQARLKALADVKYAREHIGDGLVDEIDENVEVGAEAFLDTALGGIKNVATLTFLALTELLEAYTIHLLAAIDRQAEQLKQYSRRRFGKCPQGHLTVFREHIPHCAVANCSGVVSEISIEVEYGEWQKQLKAKDEKIRQLKAKLDLRNFTRRSTI